MSPPSLHQGASVTVGAGMSGKVVVAPPRRTIPRNSDPAAHEKPACRRMNRAPQAPRRTRRRLADLVLRLRQAIDHGVKDIAAIFHAGATDPTTESAHEWSSRNK